MSFEPVRVRLSIGPAKAPDSPVTVQQMQALLLTLQQVLTDIQNRVSSALDEKVDKI